MDIMKKPLDHPISIAIGATIAIVAFFAGVGVANTQIKSDKKECTTLEKMIQEQDKNAEEVRNLFKR